ncbi:MAG: hypothetical protein ACFFEN_11625 [Candidatus Thorarchaeota archaeon]
MIKKPNIILIFPDQHTGDVLGCMGDPIVITPNLDNIIQNLTDTHVKKVLNR